MKNYDKLIKIYKLISGLIILVVQAIVFIFIYILYYKKTGQSAFNQKYLITFSTYICLLLIFSKVYDSYNIGQYKKTVLVYSQFLSNVIVNGLLYILICFHNIEFATIYPIIAVI